MFRFLKFIFIFVVMFIVIAAAGIFIFLKTVDLNKFKAQILAQASSALGIPVDMERLSFELSWKDGLTLKGMNISVEDNPQFSNEKILKLKEANLQLDVKALLRTRQIVVTQIILTSPQINLVRNKNGEINVQKLLVKEEPMTVLSHAPAAPETINSLPDADEPTVTKSEVVKEEKPAVTEKKPLPVPDFFIHSVVIEHGTLFWTDQMLDPPMNITLNDIGLKITDFSFDKDLPVEVDLAFLSSQDNLKGKGILRIEKENGEIFLKNLEAKADLSTISLEEVVKLFPQLSAAGMESPIQGKITAKVSELAAGSQGLIKLASEVNFKDGQLKFKQLASGFEKIGARVTISESDVNIESVSAGLAGGTLTAKGSLKDYFKTQQFNFNGQMDGVLIERLIEQGNLPAKAQGQVKGNFDAAGAGLTLDALKQSLNGSGHVEVADGKLVGKNILQLVVNALSMIPEAKEKIDQNLPQQYRDILESPDTIFNKVAAEMTLQGDTIVVRPVEAEAQGFLMEGSAQVNFEQNISAQAALVMVEDLSQAIAQAVPEISYLLDEEKRVYIPFTPYNGPIAKFNMRPDIAYLAEHGIKKVIDEQLEKVIPEEYKAPAKEAIDNILDLLKKF